MTSLRARLPLLLLLPIGLALPGPARAAAYCRVAIDIGHSRTVYGATSARGVTEWTDNHALAGRVAQALRQAGIPAVILDPAGLGLTLQDRPRAAAAQSATLLVSLHHDDVQDSYKHPWVWHGRTYQHSEQFSGYGLFVAAGNGQYPESQQVARDIADGLLAAHLHPSLHHALPVPGEGRPLLDRARGIYRYDGLAVLRTAPMAAVLLEAGIIVNRTDEPVIASPAYRTAVAEAIAEAARRHCQRLATEPDPIPAPPAVPSPSRAF